MPPSTFGKSTTGTEVAETYRDQIRGKHVLITGTSPNSIGEAAALALVRGARPALLILASRTASKLDEVARRQHNAGRTLVRTVVLDLASQDSVREAARAIALLTTRIDVLLNSAGVNVQRRQLSPEGIELTFATNHVGHFLLVHELLPLLRAAAAARRGGEPATRIVNVSSEGHRISPMRFSDYNFDRDASAADLPADERPRRGLPSSVLETTDGFPSVLVYCMSKCANVLFTVGLKERLLHHGIDSFALDPGNIRTNLDRDIAPGLKKMLDDAPSDFWKSPDQGCATLLVAAFDPALSGANGVYLVDCQIARPAWFAADRTKAEQLWRLSERLTNPVAGLTGLTGKNRL
ncbi:NAD(P)-binding protein [Thozetella sp. PMI_491]|nr:NAD(P)-binding protein [Thozetella sp. PMI_491]